MKSFDNKAEKMVGVLGGINKNTEKMLEKQDTTIGILKSVKEDTCYIPAMKEDTAALRTDTKEIAAKLWEKYEELSKEIAQMKITLSKIEAKVFS
jgi:metal-dependent amidase/aminoacylase/carboxypeptidase family protein